MGLILSILVPISTFVIILFVIVAAINTKSTRRDDMIKTVFNYCVLFITLMMVLGGSIGIFVALADILVPTNTDTQTYQEYKLYNSVKYVNGKDISLNDEEIKSMYEESIVLSNRKVLLDAQKNMIRSIGFVIVPLPIFLLFQRLVRKQTPQSDY